MTPTISVIVPCYNAAQWISRCWAHLSRQTFQDFEVLFVDDGSTDNTREVLAALGPDARIRVLPSPHGGVAVARNVGIDAARGRYLFFLDADDFLNTRALEICAAELDANPSADFVLFDIVRVDLPQPDERFQEPPLPPTTTTVMEHPLQDFFARLSEWTQSGSCRWCYRRSSLGDHRFIPGLILGEDSDFVFRFLRRMRRGIRLHAALYYYVRTPNSATTKPITTLNVTTGEAVLRHLYNDFAGDPKALRLLRRNYFFKALKVNRKIIQSFATATTDEGREVYRLACALERTLFADGLLTLRSLPIHWAIRLLPTRLATLRKPRRPSTSTPPERP